MIIVSVGNKGENMLENPGPFLSWLWTEASWINLSYGDILVLGSLFGFAVIIEIISHLRGKGSLFF